MPLRPGLRKRIFDLVDRELTQFVDKHFPVPGVHDTEKEPEVSPPPQTPANDVQSILLRIHEAARKRVRLYVQYDNAWRHLEPYELKYTAKNSTHPMLYARCSLHPSNKKGEPKVEAFRLDRMQDAYVTDQSFNPAWPIKIE